MQTDYRHPDLLAYAGTPLELDVYVPEYKLALEYQGIQHYHEVAWQHKSFEKVSEFVVLWFIL